MENNCINIDSLSNSFSIYMDLLQTVPNHVPLMAPKNNSVQLYQKQVKEAFLYHRFISSAQTIADIGTGSGFPGITLALLNPEKCFYLIDRRSNAIQFLCTVRKKLNLKNVELLCLRAEELIHQHWKVQAVVVRAVSRISALLHWCEPILSQHGVVVLGKGNHCEPEIKQAEFLPYTLSEKVKQPFGSLLVFTKN